MDQVTERAPLDVAALRAAIRAEYAAVAERPEQGFHFHTGYRLAAILGYEQEWIAALPPSAVVGTVGAGITGQRSGGPGPGQLGNGMRRL